MKITILSGGSGNDSLVKGLKEIYPNSDIKVIINQYDSGLSTGICREVTNTLGVSDARKNHSRMYKAMHNSVNQTIMEFYENRYDFTVGNELNEILELLNKWNLNQFKDYAIRFFNNEKAQNYEYADFNVANIIYAQMYSEIGYERTHKCFCDLLGIDDFVILNSFDNVYLNAITKDGNVIDDEGDIVNYANSEDKIVDIIYKGVKTELNQKAIDRVLNSDLIIISTGTFWSSIYPTLDYLNFYDYINQSNAKKIWAINNNEDEDAYGVTSNDFIAQFEVLGLNLNDFTILENLDSIDSLHMSNEKYNVIFKHMGNHNGKHNGLKFAKEILIEYYQLFKYDKIIFDFDDTLWARQSDSDLELKKISMKNVKLLNSKLAKYSIIVSGNTYRSISKKLYQIFGTSLSDCELIIWADTHGRQYYKNNYLDAIDEIEINQNDYLKLTKILNNFDLCCTVDNTDKIFNIKIKPLNITERKLLCSYLNDLIFKSDDMSKLYIAKMTGLTTVDIMSKNNTKAKVFDYINLKDLNTLYIGDEIDSGNDRDIAQLCTHSINVSDIYETYAILTLLEEIYAES